MGTPLPEMLKGFATASKSAMTPLLALGKHQCSQTIWGTSRESICSNKSCHQLLWALPRFYWLLPVP